METTKNINFINFCGVINEFDQVTVIPAIHSDSRDRVSIPDNSPYTLILHLQGDEVVVRPVLVSNIEPCGTTEKTGLDHKAFWCSIPFPMGADLLQFFYKENLLFERRINQREPVQKNLVIKYKNKQLLVEWDQSEGFLSHVFLQIGEDIFPLDTFNNSGKVKYDVTGIPKKKKATVIVYSTDGVIEQKMESEPIELEKTKPISFIVSPDPSDQLLVNQPFSLIGNVTDLTGKNIKERYHLKWEINNKKLEGDQNIFIPTKGGELEIRLLDKELGELDKIIVNVAQPDTDQLERYEKLMKSAFLQS